MVVFVCEIQIGMASFTGREGGVILMLRFMLFSGSCPAVACVLTSEMFVAATFLARNAVAYSVCASRIVCSLLYRLCIFAYAGYSGRAVRWMGTSFAFFILLDCRSKVYKKSTFFFQKALIDIKSFKAIRMSNIENKAENRVRYLYEDPFEVIMFR